MADRSTWRPTPEEVRRIVEEMRPILRDLARRAMTAKPVATPR